MTNHLHWICSNMRKKNCAYSYKIKSVLLWQAVTEKTKTKSFTINLQFFHGFVLHHSRFLYSLIMLNNTLKFKNIYEGVLWKRDVETLNNLEFRTTNKFAEHLGRKDVTLLHIPPLAIFSGPGAKAVLSIPELTCCKRIPPSPQHTHHHLSIALMHSFLSPHHHLQHTHTHTMCTVCLHGCLHGCH